MLDHATVRALHPAPDMQLDGAQSPRERQQVRGIGEGEHAVENPLDGAHRGSQLSSATRIARVRSRLTAPSRAYFIRRLRSSGGQRNATITPGRERLRAIISDPPQPKQRYARFVESFFRTCTHMAC